MKFDTKVQKFVECINGSDTANNAIAMAHAEYKLNAADSTGGIGSDQAAWREANDLTGWKFSSD